MPDHSTLSRRAETLEVPSPRSSGSGQIVALLLTAKDADAGAQVGPLLDQVNGPLAPSPPTVHTTKTASPPA